MQLITTNVKMEVAGYRAIAQAHQQQMASHMKAMDRYEDQRSGKLGFIQIVRLYVVLK